VEVESDKMVIATNSSSTYAQELFQNTVVNSWRTR